MIFADPIWLWGLLAVPLLALLEWRAVRRADAALPRLVGPGEEHALLAQRLPGQRRVGALLRLAAAALLIVGAAEPRWGRELVRRGATGSDVVLVVDVSASMDVRDVPPSRLEEARREALAVVDRLAGSRIGVVAFAGEANRLCPLTLDRGSVRLVISSLSGASVGEPGSDLGRALRRAAQMMPAGRREEQAVVLWTDGEDLERGARAAIEELASSGVRVYTVGVGTALGDVVPVLDDQGRAVDVKRDESGGPVRSRLDEALLRTLARRTRGAYFAASRPGGELPRLLGALDALARSGRGLRLIERPVARFPLCALLAAALLLLDPLRPRRRLPRRGREPEPAYHSERGAAAAALLLACLLASTRAEAETAWARGDRAFRAGRWAEAESLYALRLKRGASPDLMVNRATASARLGKLDDAERELRQVSTRGGRAGAAAGYNLGTLLAENASWHESLVELRRALERNPDDRDARWNYEVALRRQREDSQARKDPKPDRPQPAAPQPQASPPNARGQGQPPPQPQPPTSPPPSQGPGGAPQGGEHMNRTQAEQLLDALAAQARADLQRRQKAQVMREKHGKDW